MREVRKATVTRIARGVPRRGRARVGRPLLAALVGLLAAEAGCGERPGAAGEGEPAGAPAVRSDTSGVAAGLQPTDTATWSIGITEAPSTAAVPPLPVLTALRTGTHDGWVRVTFEVGGDSGGAVSGRPGYHVEYVDRPLIACGSGEQIFPVGDAWLRIRLEPAAAHTEQGEPTLGPGEVAVDGSLLRRIYRTCDFEGIVTYVLALSAPNPYRVVTLEDPVRIVVDVER